MKKLVYCSLAVTLVAGAVSPCFAAESTWDGTWKLNAAKSHMTGETFTYTKTGDKSYRFSNGTLQYNITCDGAVHPVLAGYSASCTESPGGSMDMTMEINGKVTSKSHRSFSEGEKIQTVDVTEYRPDGTTTSEKHTYARLSGTKGLAGKWRNTETKESSPGVMEYSVSDQVLHVRMPSEKESFDAKLDGADTAVTGPTTPQGFTTSMKLEGPTKIHYTDKLNGKVLDEGIQTLSENGKILTDVEWIPGKSAEKQTYVYEKQ